MTTPRYMGLNDFVEELSRLLLRAPLKPEYRDPSELVADVASAVRGFLQETLRPNHIGYDVWETVATPDGLGIVPTRAFGNVYTPSLVIDVAERPTVAFHLRRLADKAQASREITEALGTAIVYSQQYPAVILLLFCPHRVAEISGLLDREIVMELWSSHKIRLLLRQT